MFGFGLGKLVVLAIVVAAVWYGFKFVTRLDRQRKAKVDRDRDQKTESIDQMEKCPTCGTYVLTGKAQDCGRPGCPY